MWKYNINLIENFSNFLVSTSWHIRVRLNLTPQADHACANCFIVSVYVQLSPASPVASLIFGYTEWAPVILPSVLVAWQSCPICSVCWKDTKNITSFIYGLRKKSDHLVGGPLVVLLARLVEREPLLTAIQISLSL